MVNIESDGGANVIHANVNGLFGTFELGIADGLLGMDVLGSYASFTIDLKKQTLTVVE